MFSVGNHDLGVNAYSQHKIGHDDTRPVFKHFFPQNTDDSNQVPLLEHRRSYFAHRLGSEILFLSLDTGYEVDINMQTDWIDQELSATYKHKFIQYHHPLYSACHKGEEGFVAGEGRREWVPVFDKHNVTMVFENHVHGFKRSKPLKNNEVTEKGTVYIGDGSWGPLVHSCKPANRDLIETNGLYNHVWVIEIDDTNEVKAAAYDETGELIDWFSHSVN